MQSSISGHPIHQKIVRLMDELKPLGVAYVHLRFCGTTAHFVPDEPINTIDIGKEKDDEKLSTQQYFPVAAIPSSVIVLAKDIHHPW